MGKGVEVVEIINPTVVSGTRETKSDPTGVATYIIDRSDMSDGSKRRYVHTEGIGDPEWKPPSEEMTE